MNKYEVTYNLDIYIIDAKDEVDAIYKVIVDNHESFFFDFMHIFCVKGSGYRTFCILCGEKLFGLSHEDNNNHFIEKHDYYNLVKDKFTVTRIE